MKRSLLTSFLVIGAVAAMITAATTAVFTDTVTSEDNTFSTGTLLLSVDGECGPGSDPARTTGGECSITETFSATGVAPGDEAESHTFQIKNEGSIDGLLSISVDAQSTGSCAVNGANGGWTVTYTAVNDVALAAGDSYPDGWEVSVALDEEAGNECQGVTLTVDVTFELEQDI